MTISTFNAQATTTNATATPITLMQVPQDSVVNMTIFLNAKSTAGDVFAGQLVRVVKRIGAGNAAPVGTQVVLSSQKDTGANTWAATLGGSGANIIITVTGSAATTINWNISATASVTN